MLTAIVVLLYLATLVLGVFILLLYRQFGLLALGSAQAIRLPGPRVGRVLRRAPVPLIDADGHSTLVRLAARERYLYVLFALPGSPFDAELADAVRTFAAHLTAEEELLVISRASLDARFARRVGDGVTLLIDPTEALFRALDLEVGPYFFALDAAGVLLCRDLVNNLENLEFVRERASIRTSTPSWSASQERK
jgi:hypothetical protein